MQGEWGGGLKGGCEGCVCKVCVSGGSKGGRVCGGAVRVGGYVEGQ